MMESAGVAELTRSGPWGSRWFTASGKVAVGVVGLEGSRRGPARKGGKKVAGPCRLPDYLPAPLAVYKDPLAYGKGCSRPYETFARKAQREMRLDEAAVGSVERDEGDIPEVASGRDAYVRTAACCRGYNGLRAAFWV